MNNKNEKINESGSAILWILIAVVLFGALNFAFNSSSRTSTSLLTSSEATAYANQIIAYGNEVKAAVKRLQLRGCDETEISFENSVIGPHVNPNAPASRKCHIFDVAGGGLSYTAPPASWVDATYSGGSFFQEAHFSGCNAIEDVGGSGALGVASSAELTFNIPYLRPEICQQINEQLGHSFASPPTETSSICANPFLGTYGAGGQIQDGAATNIDGQKNLCMNIGTDTIFGGHFFYMTLIARD